MPMKWLKEVFTLVVGEAGGKFLRDLLAGELREGAKVIAERIKTVIKENPRADLFFAFLEMDPQDAASIWQEYRKVRGTAQENSFAVTLGQALRRNPDGTIDVDRAKNVMSRIAAMDEAEFSDAMEFLKHDPIAAHMRDVLKKGRGAVEAVIAGVAYAAGRADHKAVEWKAELQPTADKLRAAAQKKGWRAWLDF